MASNTIREVFGDLKRSGTSRGEDFDAVYSLDYLQATLREHREQIQWVLKDIIVNLER